jgi:SH3 domain-containing protein
MTTLWAKLRVATLFALLSVVCSSVVWGQQATTKRKAVLHRDPTTSSKRIETLQKGARLVLVDASQDSGFYHVQTEDDQIGWIVTSAVEISSTPPTPPQKDGCDPNIATHVYHPNRLIVQNECITVTGTIMDATANQNTKEPDGVRHEKDGDTHGWLRVDATFENLLNAGNKNDEGGNLVFEIICKFPVTQPDAKTACQGYTDHVTLPPVGSHVQIVGRYVQDTFHGQWMEIHPVTSINVIP